MSYELLSQPIRKFINDQRWESLRPIQVAAITRILTTEDHYILASRTASGKTEAAFLPILSKVNFKEAGVQVLYISPLKALINDQFLRIEELCQYMDVKVTKWHGDANRTQKEKLVRQPEGITLITPESLEAMFVNKPFYINTLFPDLKFIVIDEIHSFIGTERGMHLKSLIARLRMKTKTSPRIIGLSATIGDYQEAKRLTGEEQKTKVLLDKTTRALVANFKYVEVETEELPPAFIEELYWLTKDKKVLIFPNSRGRAEEIAVKLKKLSESRKGHPYYFSHHSSIDKELREHIEHFAKTNERHYFAIVCTSTLELGIDIGSVDLVVQVNAPFSVSSLIQRVGRSGRRKDATGNLHLYATDPWELLQSLACWELYKEEFNEPLHAEAKPFGILFHQLLSLLKETSGITRTALFDWIKANPAFTAITSQEANFRLDDMIGKDFIEDLKRELILGLEGERLVSSRNFYTVFKSEENFNVIHAGKQIGEIPMSPQVSVGENIFLAARIWKITDVNPDAARIEVSPAKDGRKPLFPGGGGDIHPRVREKMLELLYSSEAKSELDESAVLALNELRQTFHRIPVTNLSTDRPLLRNEHSMEWYTFSGTAVNRTIAFLLKAAGISTVHDDKKSVFEFENSSCSINEIIVQAKKQLTILDTLIDQALEDGPHVFNFTKWSIFLPDQYKKVYLMDRYFDRANAAAFLDSVDVKSIPEL
jgi:ATP-dependent Lhr-like helicase